MIEIFLICIVIAIVVVALYYFAVFLALAYSYLSIGMAPVMWVLLVIGLVVGLIYSTINAVKAIRNVYGKKKGAV